MLQLDLQAISYVHKKFTNLKQPDFPYITQYLLLETIVTKKCVLADKKNYVIMKLSGKLEI